MRSAALCFVWFARLAVAQQQSESILYVTNTFSVSPKDATLSTEGVFELHIPAHTQANWTASKGGAPESMKAEAKDELVSLDSEDLGDSGSLQIRGGEAPITCAQMSIDEYVEGTLNPSYHKVKNAKQALKENGYSVALDLGIHKAKISTTDTIGTGKKANFSHAERLRALFDWSSELQQIAARQIVQYMKECPGAKALELGQGSPLPTSDNSSSTNDTAPTPPPTSDPTSDNSGLGHWDGHWATSTVAQQKASRADPPKFPNRRRRQKVLGEEDTPKAESWRQQFAQLPRGEPANSNRFAGMTPEQVSDLTRLGKDLPDLEALKRVQEANACVKGECNNQTTPANSSVLSGLRPEDIASSRFNQSAKSVGLAWCGRMKCGCDMSALNDIKNRSILRAPDTECQCWVATKYSELDASGLEARAEILEEEPIKPRKNQTSTNPEVERALESLESELSIPKEVKYACGAQAQLQCVETARKSLGELQGWFLDWRRDKCLEGPNEKGTLEDDIYPTQTGQDARNPNIELT